MKHVNRDNMKRTGKYDIPKPSPLVSDIPFERAGVTVLYSSTVPGHAVQGDLTRLGAMNQATDHESK